MLALGLLLGMAVVFFLLVFIYTHLDKKFMKKFSEFSNREREVWGGISKVKGASNSEVRELKERLDSLESKLDLLLQPEGEAKELAKEKLKSVARSGARAGAVTEHASF